ncbi:high-affinity iron permease [Sporothrix stenoceras]|uniref:High-affinity iron permease n=1 Tax=Sporothrix stenoceras TaxID=5173 RepID=A0ABR3ZTJ6_9PEZI
MAVEVFSIPVFLVVFRESLETVIIVSVLLAFLKQTFGRDETTTGNVEIARPADNVNGSTDIASTNRRNTPYRHLVRQVWIGTLTGLVICLCIAAVIIAIFYTVGTDHWAASEENYEGAFALVASLIISIVGAALLRISRMQDKWRVKLAAALQRTGQTTAEARNEEGNATKWQRFRVRVETFPERYALFVLPFITVLREGIEAIVFVAGVSFSAPAKSVPLPVVVGLLAGISVGYLLYKGGASARLQVFLVASTGLLYLVAAGLFSRAVWSFEMQVWNKVVGSDAAELGSGPGSYDIDKSVWHINCCNPELNGGGGWGFFNAVLGWTNSATYGSVLAYNLYWLVMMLAFASLRYHEVHGAWPWQWTRRRKPFDSAGLQQQDLQLPDIVPVSPLHPTTVTEVASEKVA